MLFLHFQRCFNSPEDTDKKLEDVFLKFCNTLTKLANKILTFDLTSK